MRHGEARREIDLDVSFPARIGDLEAQPPIGVAAATGQLRPRAVAALMGGFNLRWLNELFQVFGGDLLQPLVLGHVVLPGGALAPHAAARCGAAGIAAATGLARETARRTVALLMRGGWLEPSGPGTCAATRRTSDHYAFGAQRRSVADLLWTMNWLRSVLDLDAAGLAATATPANFLLALTTRAHEFGADVQSAQHALLARAAPGEPSPAELERAALALAAYQSRHIARLYKAFAGDLVAPLLLGEIGHHTVSGLVYRYRTDPLRIDALLDGAHAAALSRRECNAHSLAVVTGIPDTTVRRRVEAFLRRGWIVKGPSGSFAIGDKPMREFAPTVNAQTLDDLLAMHDMLGACLAGLQDGASWSPARGG